MAAAANSDERMSDAEALMWRLEQRDPRLRAVIAVVVLLDRSPGIADLRHRVNALTRELPRFRCCVAPAVSGLAAPWWEPDPTFEVAEHVTTTAAPGAGTLDDVLALAGPLVAEGLERDRPLWHMTLVEGMAAGRAALVIRLHHTFTDGLGALKLAMVLFDLDADAPPPDLPDVGVPAAPGSAARLLGELRHEAGVAAGVARWALPTVGGLVRGAARDPEAEARATTEMARSVARVVTPSGRPCSSLMTGRSTSSVFGMLSLPLDEARALARAAGATVNDVFLSAVLAGLSRYHAAHGSHPEVLRLGMPVNLRAPDDDSLRNQFFPARMLAPLQISDPMDRLRAVHQLVVGTRSEPAMQAYGPLAAVAGRLGATDRVIGRVLLSMDVMASNVIGSADPLYLAGARVLRIVPFGPRGGAGLNLTTVSYDGTLQVGANMDPAATPDTAGLLAALDEAFSDVAIYA